MIKQRLNKVLMTLATFSSTFASGQQLWSRWAVGPVASSSPGISLLYLTDPFEGYHFSAFLNDSDRTVFAVDWQKYFGVGSSKTPMAPWGNIAVYSGIGIESVSSLEEATASADLRIPVGVEFSSKQLPMQIFGDVAAIIGPLPTTNFRGSPRLGIRAVF